MTTNNGNGWRAMATTAAEKALKVGVMGGALVLQKDLLKPDLTPLDARDLLGRVEAECNGACAVLFELVCASPTEPIRDALARTHEAQDAVSAAIIACIKAAWPVAESPAIETPKAA